jgi:autotransporter strand-loop-strand O-heptosyltransferase
MAHIEQKAFCNKVKLIFPQYFSNKKVLDIGSLDINGNNKILFDNCSYIGLDLGEGKNVDVIGSGHLYDAPDEYFDTIISTEAFEHDMFYEKTISNIIRMLKPGGLFLFTCAAPGRPEHGTRRTGGFDAPLLIHQSEKWADYYKNLTDIDIQKIPSFNINFPDGYFEINNHAEIPSDLYFYGIKGGSKYLIDSIVTTCPKDQFNEDIIVIDCWPDNSSKESDLVNLIKRVKVYNIPILLTGHYPIKPEIQRMVDYYLYDKNNPILTNDHFNEFGVNSVRWTEIGDLRIENHREFHHDYAIWETMRNCFNFCKFLGKKYIHFMEYDNLPDVYQYRQAFIEHIRRWDAVLYEYDKGSTTLANPYCATYIFSVRTDVAISTIDIIKSKDEFFRNKPDKWQLESNFFNSLRQVTNKFYVCEYIPNEKELNKQAVWNRDDINRNGIDIQFYLAVNEFNYLYLHVIPKDDCLIEVEYQNYKQFHNLQHEGFFVQEIGKYKKGYTVKVYHEGVEIFNQFLGSEVDKFRKYNIITSKGNSNHIPKEVNINFVDGPFVEIKEDAQKLYHVQFINAKTNFIEYELDLKSNHWAKSSKKYYIDWIIKIQGIDNDYEHVHVFNMAGKRVLISFESKSLGDTLAWFPYVEKFRNDKRCEVICSTFHNNLFYTQYPNIKFIEPGTSVDNIYALYRVGLFVINNSPDYTKHPSDPKKDPLMKVGSDILGLDYIELKPNLPILGKEKKKVVSIAIHGTAQCKYWNNPNGWQEVVNFLVDNGYEVKLLSKEEDGYMGNKNPKNITVIYPGKIEKILKIIQESEMFIGISSGLSWLSWAAGTETILISGFTDDYLEPKNGVRRVINKNVCNSCWNIHIFDPGDWNWCPVHKGTNRSFECSKLITSQQVIDQIQLALKL